MGPTLTLLKPLETEKESTDTSPEAFAKPKLVLLQGENELSNLPHAARELMRKVCAWCNAVLENKDAPKTTHGICATCMDKALET